MLSILIPIYNYNAYPLVLELHKQCIEMRLKYEIIVIDDGSLSTTNKENKRINSLDNCVFIPLAENVGLSTNRNLLTSKAKYSNLLFIDGDSIVIQPNYIKNYIAEIENSDIIYGGRIHPETISSAKQKLRWKYGKKIEDKPVIKRNLDIYKTLMFNNTLIKKECFNTIKFASSLKKYGHEDTLLAYQISLLNFKVKHIENAIEHGDIDENIIFISKVKYSLKNLIILDNERKIEPTFIKILSLYHFLKRYKLDFLIASFFILFDKILFSQLVSKNPSLFIFNLYRISYLCSLKK